MSRGLFSFLLAIVLVLIPAFLVLPRVYAQAEENERAHITVVMNQVRGSECCDAGNLEYFQSQLEVAERLELPVSFALRSDVLTDPEYQDLIARYPEVSYGVLLEVTPGLAARANVTYKGTKEQWYEAQNVFLFGYTQAERKALIDTYMELYQQVFSKNPSFTSAWMIDPWSLKYLKEEYGVRVHQITREQFGTDSYTLYGGPMQMPYIPSENWALVPGSNSSSMPIIVRQTVMDPVYNYGDRSNSYTSQPNDYAIRGVGLEYFSHLFAQAHAQENRYTFVLLGLENSMDKKFQDAFEAQLAAVADWRSETNTVLSAEEFAEWFARQTQDEVQVYAGTSVSTEDEKAWWITTANYRVRVRLSAGELAITDIRVYSPAFTDPYRTDTPTKLGWWIVPAVLDASRTYADAEDQLTVHTDMLKNRPDQYGQPVRLVLAQGVAETSVRREGELIHLQWNDTDDLTFASETFSTQVLPQVHGTQKTLAEVLSVTDADGAIYWKVAEREEAGRHVFTPQTVQTDLDAARKQLVTKLFPEVNYKPLSVDTSYLFTNNAYAVAGRNPVRLVLFPRDDTGQGVLLEQEPVVTVADEKSQITVHEQHGSNGMVFIDVMRDEPKTTEVTVQASGFQKELQVFFAPHCARTPAYCLTHPRQAIWFIRALIGDKLRFRQQASDTEQQFVD